MCCAALAIGDQPGNTQGPHMRSDGAEPQAKRPCKFRHAARPLAKQLKHSASNRMRDGAKGIRSVMWSCHITYFGVNTVLRQSHQDAVLGERFKLRFLCVAWNAKTTNPGQGRGLCCNSNQIRFACFPCSG